MGFPFDADAGLPCATLANSKTDASAWIAENAALADA
jgi:hypothetical protein